VSGPWPAMLTPNPVGMRVFDVSEPPDVLSAPGADPVTEHLVIVGVQMADLERQMHCNVVDRHEVRVARLFADPK